MINKTHAKPIWKEERNASFVDFGSNLQLFFYKINSKVEGLKVYIGHVFIKPSGSLIYPYEK